MIALGFEVVVGGLTFTGSLMAAGKLQELLPGRPITYRGQNISNIALLSVHRRDPRSTSSSRRRATPCST